MLRPGAAQQLLEPLDQSVGGGNLEGVDIEPSKCRATSIQFRARSAASPGRAGRTTTGSMSPL
jgi:hypothetical protein